MDDNNTRFNTSNIEGEYYLLEKDNWFELKMSLNTSKSRVNRIPIQYKGMELRIYVNTINYKNNIGAIEWTRRVDVGEEVKTALDYKNNIGTIECAEYLLLNKKIWKDVRKSQGEDKGKPYFVTESCLIRFPMICKNKRVKMYVKKLVK